MCNGQPHTKAYQIPNSKVPDAHAHTGADKGTNGSGETLGGPGVDQGTTTPSALKSPRALRHKRTDRWITASMNQ